MTSVRTVFIPEQVTRSDAERLTKIIKQNFDDEYTILIHHEHYIIFSKDEPEPPRKEMERYSD